MEEALHRSASERAHDDERLDLLAKTQEFFQICDTENKGFVARRDMQRLNGELPLTPEELENVFDSLDADGNGFLTLEEFSSGFSEFLFGRRISVAESMPVLSPTLDSTETSPELLYQSQWEEKLLADEDEDEDEEEKHFSQLMESLGADSVFEEPGEVRNLWVQLRRDEPHLVSNFEEFLARVIQQIKVVNDEKEEMENTLRRRAATHDDEIQHLYEEMEQQIKSEKDRILHQDSERFLSRSQNLELQLSSKERELENLIQKQKRLESQWQELHSEQRQTQVENVKLKRINEELVRELERTSQELTLTQDQLSLLQEQSSHLREDREMEMYRVTEGLQREKASLLKQLDLLREMNKHLRDERDMCYLKPVTPATAPSQNQRSGSTPLKSAERRPSGKSEDENGATPYFRRKSSLGLSGLTQEVEAEGGPTNRRHLPRIISIEEDHLPQFLQQEFQAQLQQLSEEEEQQKEQLTNGIQPTHTPSPSKVSSPSDEGTPLSPRGQPVGKETILPDEKPASAPDRLFKIVVVGNSGVGKTSLLRRFCDGFFHAGTSATVGIDYIVRTLTVDDTQVVFQLWDTAGQERFRSITKQFFRKADGVVVMYDITAEQSFKAVRQWLSSVQEGAGEDIPVLLLGNKTDRENKREVQRRLGEILAKDCQLEFYECSAFSGYNVTESMVHLARILKEQEDQEKEKTVQLLDDSSRKRSCCLRQ
ncbi:ras and EF-hand domain-containing protein-like isoform X1 [Scleropages formosus]|uniref:Calcium release activated channel regulator 2A n=1 Tax=Scleropages formosus TaxID=113540 RepID=A0A8C9R648_SCLFO|nr:ras and EF-hand domain-containing protein-like isoform X1 [Scleropages formosus]XP_018610375.1 ras and EF-hand domain-containing protein-like isoform X1 [Scleropages formosus]XP_018610376.1 ras and EF-hand domain-containing protein-like isoform X1 [Scleropages formosus]XP_018610377.1 ras and EF-hand domain-containing protein-like isoform X1 [Scleropages formosus]XP_018610378.1 ras and EF-hand domain-containing protein-like isoform X1 [Scleropages formosus]XP_029107527.1 ras and EF-hand doma